MGDKSGHHRHGQTHPAADGRLGERPGDWERGQGERSAGDGQEAEAEAEALEEAEDTVSGRVPDSAEDLPFVSSPLAFVRFFIFFKPLICQWFANLLRLVINVV